MRGIRTLLCVLSLTICANANTGLAKDGLDTRPSKETFRLKRLWHFAALPLWLPAWTQVHEGSHALTAIGYGYEINSYKPWPHYKKGRFVFGSVSFPASKNHDGYLLIGGAPYITDFTVFTATDLLLSTGVINPDGLAGGVAYIGGMIAPLVDFTFNMAIRSGPDRQNIARSLGVNETKLMLISDAIVAVGLWRLYVNGKRVFWDTDRTSPPKERVQFLPVVSPDSAGFALSLTW